MRKPLLLALISAIAAVLTACAADPRDTGSANPDTSPTTPSTQTTPTGETTAAPPAGTTAENETSQETVEPEATAEATEEEEPFAEGPATSNTAEVPAAGTNGMVSSAHPLATEAGLEVLADGGNAFDAAVTVAASLGVVEPMMSGIGGWGAILVYDAEIGEARFLEAGSRMPADLDPGAFRAPTPGYTENRCGAMTVVTPGNVNAWETMWEEYGELAWPQLLEPAVAQAREGFVLGEKTAGWIRSEYPFFPAGAQEIYGRDGTPLAAGDVLVQEDLAGSLELIAAGGADALYEGELGEAIVAGVQSEDGFLGMQDLRDNQARWREPVGTGHRGYSVLTPSSPSTAWNTHVRLGILGQLDPATLGHNTTAHLHAFTETSKQASAAIRTYAQDPGPDTLDALLSESYQEERASEVDFSRAAPLESVRPYDQTSYCSPTDYLPPASYAPTSHAGTAAQEDLPQEHTTHFVVADREGNVVSATQTIGHAFGSKVMPEGTGVWLNDYVTGLPFEPTGGVFDIAPGRQGRYVIGPAMILRDGRPWAALGTPGGLTIPQTTTQMISNLTDFGMDVQQAVSEPRASFVQSGVLLVEPGISPEVRDELSALGHDVGPLAGPPFYALGNAHALTVEYGPDGEPSRFAGAADPRGEGVAAGL